MKIIYSPRCVEYEDPGHPESPTRVEITQKYLEKRGYCFQEPKPCTAADLELVHSEALITSVKRNRFRDADTPNLPGIFDFARLSAGGAITAMECALEKENAFSLMRPPGHHAGRQFLGGFCYFNNIAVAVKKALKKVSKVAIIDTDGHHGNGTQDIFFGNNRVIYVSLHQMGAFPSTGFTSEGNCLNYPLRPGTVGRDYISVLGLALDRVSDFKPDIVAVSAGFDTYKEESILEFKLEEDTYYDIGKMIAGLKKPVFAVLEGGYTGNIPECVHLFLKGIEK